MMPNNKINEVMKTINFYIGKYANLSGAAQLIFTVNLNQGAITSMEVQTKERIIGKNS